MHSNTFRKPTNTVFTYNSALLGKSMEANKKKEFYEKGNTEAAKNEVNMHQSFNSPSQTEQTQKNTSPEFGLVKAFQQTKESMETVPKNQSGFILEMSDQSDSDDLSHTRRQTPVSSDEGEPAVASEEE